MPPRRREESNIEGPESWVTVEGPGSILEGFNPPDDEDQDEELQLGLQPDARETMEADIEGATPARPITGTPALSRDATEDEAEPAPKPRRRAPRPARSARSAGANRARSSSHKKKASAKKRSPARRRRG